MNQQLLKKQFIARAKMLAHVMTSTSNIKVTVSGTGAYRQPGLINIPSGDFSDPEWVSMVEGWIDHELGHEDETCFNVTKLATKESRLLNDFRQIIEDVRMEKSRGEKFRGARQNLSLLAELAIKRGLFSMPSAECDPLTSVQMLCLYYGRSHIIQQTCLNDYADLAKQIVSTKLGNKLMTELCSIIDRVEHAKNNADSLMLAREIISLLQDEHDDQQSNSENDEQQEGEEEQNSDDSNSNSGSGNSDENEQDDTDASPEKEQNDSSSSDGSENSSDEEDGDDNTSGTSPSDQQNENDDIDDTDNQDSSNQQPEENEKSDAQPTSQEILNALEELLNSNAEGLKDFHEALSDYLSQEAEDAQEEQPELASMPSSEMVNLKTLNQTGTIDEVTAKRLSGGVYQTMHKVLFDQVQSLEAPRRTGSRILNSKLTGIPCGNLNVYKRHVEQQEITAAISVIVDASGSMDRYVDHQGNTYSNEYVNGTKLSRMMTHANTCALAFAAGLNRNGIACEVSYYGLNDGSHQQLYIAKQYDQRPTKTKFLVHHSGSTPTGEMIMHSLSTLALRKENKKMLFVLTDGEPNNSASVTTAVQLATSLGIKVIPIGICTKMVRGFSEGEFVTVNDPSQLTSALRDAIKLKLFH